MESDAQISMQFPDPEKLPPPVLQLQNISFGYPGSDLLYDSVDFGVDLDSRYVASLPRSQSEAPVCFVAESRLWARMGRERPHF